MQRKSTTKIGIAGCSEITKSLEGQMKEFLTPVDHVSTDGSGQENESWKEQSSNDLREGLRGGAGRRKPRSTEQESGPAHPS